MEEATGQEVQDQKQRAEVLDSLRNVIDPDLDNDIVTLRFVKNLVIDGANVTFDLRLTTPACPIKEKFISDCECAIKSSLPWVENVEVNIIHDKQVKSSHQSGEEYSSLGAVSWIVAITSCKGGVGKSTTAVNLAYTLSLLGASVGILDADVYGPSLPTLIPSTKGQFVRFGTVQEAEAEFPADSKKGKKKRNQIEIDEESSIPSNETPISGGTGDLAMIPLSFAGVKLMSYEYIQKENTGLGFSALRGPLVSGISQQMLVGTHWGVLDYLIIDFPPGTGDIPITLADKIDAAIVISTPQDLSVEDVTKGIKQLHSCNVPVISLVSNFAYFVCPSCNEKHNIFNGTMELNETLRAIEHRASIPMYSELSRMNSRAFPFVFAADENDKVKHIFKKLAEDIAQQLAVVRFSGHWKPSISITEDSFIEVSTVLALPRFSSDHPPSENEDQTILTYAAPVHHIRQLCGCEICSVKPNNAERNVYVKNLEQTTRYSVTISWSDDHESVFSFPVLAKICKNFETESRVKEKQSKCTEDGSLAW